MNKYHMTYLTYSVSPRTAEAHFSRSSGEDFNSERQSFDSDQAEEKRELRPHEREHSAPLNYNTIRSHHDLSMLSSMPAGTLSTANLYVLFYYV